MPVGRLVLMRSVARKDMVSAMSWLLIPALVGPILGPPVGGMIRHLSRLALDLLHQRADRHYRLRPRDDVHRRREGQSTGRFDIVGFVLSGISLGSLLFGFEMSSREGEGSFAVFLISIGLLFGIAYLRHARKHPSPIMDFSLMKVPSFGTSVIAGSLTRITQGAQPFLMPLMLQLGFGLSAASAGQISIATALGSMAMKPIARTVLRRLGFRTSLLIYGVIGTLGYALCATFRPDWPLPLIFVILVLLRLLHVVPVHGLQHHRL